MKVLIIVDVFGWAFDFVARGIQRYSKHECIIKRWNEVEPSDGSVDCLFCLNDSVWFAMGPHQKYFVNTKRKCVGIRGEEMPSDRILNGWVIGAVNKRIHDDLKSRLQLPINGLYLTRNGVDTEIFKLTERDDRKFLVGWCGNPTQPLKRFELLSLVQYPMLIQDRWGPRFFQKDRSRSEMTEFYRRINAFINVSLHEGMPQSILEAAATKLPIVVTDAGGMAEFVDREWMVPVNPPNVMIMELNLKLAELKANPSLRNRVGELNLHKIQSEWTWSIRAKDYDNMFEGA